MIEDGLCQTRVTVFIRIGGIVGTAVLIDPFAVAHFVSVHQILCRVGTSVSGERTGKAYRQEYFFYLIGIPYGACKDNFIVVYRIGRETFVIVILRISRIVQSVRGTLLVILSDEVGCCLRRIRPVCGVAVRIVQFGSTVEQGSCL